MLSDQGGDEEDQAEEGDDVGFSKHGADDGGRTQELVSGDVLGDGLVGEAEHNQ